MSEQSVVMAGLKAVEGMSIEDIERILDWLEEATRAYHAVLAVKRAFSHVPRGLEIPSSLVSIADPVVRAEEPKAGKIELRRTPTGMLGNNVARDAIEEVLKDHPGGMSPYDLSQATGIPRMSIQATLNRNRERYTKLGRGRWAYRTNGQAVTIEGGDDGSVHERE